MRQSWYPLMGDRYQIIHQYIRKPTHPFTVYLAEDLDTDQQVIIKQVNRFAPADPEATQLLRREEATLRRIRHNRFPMLIDSFLDRGQWTLVLSFIAGPPLTEALRQRAAPGPQHHDQATVINFGLALCHLLHYLHTRTPPIIHRDVKPGNIILGLDRSCALIDFGNAREYRVRQSRTIWWSRRTDDGDTFPGIGTAGYAPPEQYPSEGTVSRTTPVSDLYSVGAILYQMITGFNPGDKPVPMRFHYPPPISYVTSGGISYDLALLIMQMLEWKPERRPESAYEVIRRLEGMQAH